jgi:hypothetical protein
MDDQEGSGSSKFGSTEHASDCNTSSSMLPLRAVLAKAKAAAVERRKNKSGISSKVRSKRPITAVEKQFKKNKGIEDRIRSDEHVHVSDHSSKEWKNVKKNLEMKAKMYDEIVAGGGSESGKVSDLIDNQHILVDFGRKKTPSVAEEHGDQSEFDQIRDEFGREKTVPINSSEYRVYIAEEARQKRLQDIQRAQWPEHHHFNNYDNPSSYPRCYGSEVNDEELLSHQKS